MRRFPDRGVSWRIGKHTNYVFPSVVEVLRAARNERELDDLLIYARLHSDASASTKRKWSKVAEQVRGALRVRALEVSLVLP